MAPKREKKESTERGGFSKPLESEESSQNGHEQPTEGGENTPQSAAAKGDWTLNSKILCRYVNSEVYYEAKIIGINQKDGENVYAIHYQGWHKRHDEKVPESVAAIRFKSYTDEEAEKAKVKLKRAQQGTKKRKSVAASDSKRGGGGDDSSRASSPSVRSSAPTDVSGPPSKRSRHRNVSGSEPIVDSIKSERKIKKVILPEALRKILVDDNNLVSKQGMLPKIPARVTVAQIVQKYRESLVKTPEQAAAESHPSYIEFCDGEDVMIQPTTETCLQSASGLLDYFDMTIDSLLLYKFERPLYSDLYAEESDKLTKAEGDDSKILDKDDEFTYGKVRLSNKFGLAHLLRLFVRFSEMLSYTQWSMRALNAIVRHAQEFVMFLEKHHHEYYNINEDYMIAPPEYQKRVWDSVNQ